MSNVLKSIPFVAYLVTEEQKLKKTYPFPSKSYRLPFLDLGLLSVLRYLYMALSRGLASAFYT